MIFRRSKYAAVIDAQLDLFLREHRDVLEDAATRLEQYNAAERDEAEELYGDYVDAVETGTDYSREIPTLVEFTLEKTATGTRLRVVESGFDKLPAHRRDIAFRSNEGGWTGRSCRAESRAATSPIPATST